MLNRIRSLAPIMRFQCINPALGSPISSHQRKCQQKQLTMHGKSLTVAGFKTAAAVVSAVQNKTLTNTEALMVKTPTRQFSKCAESMDKKKRMDQAIQRFVARLNLPDGFSFMLVDCRENENDVMLDKFNNKRRANKFLQLYHAQRDSDHSGSICNTGFHCSYYGNKGVGVYLANHSRYAWNWASPKNPVLICEVIADEERISRYRSEIFSPTWDSEYVVNDPELVYPRYILKYKIEWKMPRQTLDQIGFVKHGEFGCVPCDSKLFGNRKGTRCDCELEPKIDPRDVVEIE